MDTSNWETDPDVQAELQAMAGLVQSKSSDTPKLRKMKKRKTKMILKKPAVKEKIKKKPRASVIGSIEQIELLNIIKQPAFTSEEKYKVLEARDKLIRLRTKKTTDITSAKHIVGTCPDMCPERERLMREVQHQVSVYEQEPGEKTMNPFLAVKQYSRSSADQEVPLPHDLRPVAVLQRTMLYLLHKIVNLCDNPDTNLAEWYHFLWDRTRAIRKDITQQELCCRGSVELVEQCARFHIHCSARLVAEDPSVFDQKINTENLTKCLQTLKYMYHDLELKNQSCPNEPEFRAYIILLNLNDANFMWEVQQLRPEIQKSEAIHFALKVYSALDKNNYVRFFNLVRSTSYLNACILLRYFVQVRLLALKTIVKSYSPRMPYTQFPTEQLKNILAFEGNASTADFVEYHGLQLNESRTHIILARKSFQMPEFSYTLDRAIQVIESKRHCSVGEVICGRYLDEIDFEEFIPHDSFDPDGILDIDQYIPDIDLTILEQKELNERPVRTESDDRSSDIFNKPSATQVGNIFALKSSSESRSSSPMDTLTDKNQEFRTDTTILWSKSDKSPFPSNKLENLSKTSSIFAMSPQIKTTILSFPVKPATSPASSIFPTPILPGSIFAQPPPKPIKIEDQTDKSSALFNQNPSIGGGGRVTLPNFFQPPITKPDSKLFFTQKTNASDFFEPPLQTPPKKSGGFRFNLQTKVAPSSTTTPSVFKHSQLTSHEDHLRRQKEEAARFQRELEEKIRLENDRKRQLEEMRLQAEKQAMERRKIEEDLARKRIEEEMILKRKILEEERRKQIALEQERLRLLAQQKEMEELERKRAAEMKSTIRSIIEELVVRVDENITRDKLKSISQRIKSRKALFYFRKWRNCVAVNKRKRKSIDQWPIWINATTLEEEARELRMRYQDETLQYMKRYKSGVPIRIEVCRDLAVDRIDLEKLSRQILSRNFRRSTVRPAENCLKIDVFVASLSYMNTNLKWVENVLNELFDWKDNDYKLVEDVKVLNNTIRYCIQRKQCFKYESTDGFVFVADEFSEEFCCDLRNILKNVRKCADLPLVLLLQNDDFERDSLENLLRKNDRHLATELWKRTSSYAKWNEPYRVCLTNPEIVISLYNEALCKLESIVFDENSAEFPDFPEIFQSAESIDEPVMPCNYKYFPKFWKNDSYRRKLNRVFSRLTLPKFETNWPPKDVKELETMISEFCLKFFRDPFKKVYKIIASILKSFDPIEDFSEIKNVLWTEVIEVAILEKLEEIDFSLREPFVSVFKELFVVYNKNDLADFNTTAWFYLSNPIIQNELNTDDYRVEEEEEEDVLIESEGEIDLSKEDLETSLIDVAQERLDREKKLNDSKRDLREFEIMMADLEQSMNVQKQINARFNQILTQALRE
ncbi:SAC3/GANP family [Popillia japonica]|uniref:Germinal-center associated nuclear protein n=1 Tax=Popillia japonica TaxID=7064 RepID=A0AAW1MFJ0_POPJA